MKCTLLYNTFSGRGDIEKNKTILRQNDNSCCTPIKIIEKEVLKMKKTAIIQAKAICALLLIVFLFSGVNTKTYAATHTHSFNWVTIRSATCSQSGYQL